MDTDKKLIALIIVLVISTVAIIYFRRDRGVSDKVLKQEQQMLCLNPQCKANFMTTLEKLRDETAKMDSIAMQSFGPPKFTCSVCGQKTAVEAVKCPYCGEIFISNISARDFRDRCPKCGKSETEEKRRGTQP